MHSPIQKKLEWLIPLFIIPYYITLINGMSQIYENVYHTIGWEGLFNLASSNMAMIFFFVLISSASIALYRLFQAKDLNLLMSLPIHDRSLFEAKFSESFGDTMRNMILPFPIFIAFSLVIYKKLSLSYLVIFIVGLIFILIQITSISMIIGFLLGKITAKGKWSVISRITAVASAFILLVTFMIYIQQKDGTMQINYYNIRLINKIIAVFPTSWLIKSIAYNEDTISRFTYGSAFFLLTIISIIFSFVLFKLRFRTIWMEITEFSPRRKSQRAKKVNYRGRIKSILSKDFQTLYREPNLLISLIVPIILYPLFIVFKDQDIRMHIFYIVLI
ncbi:MAG: putative ABC transporter permease subunit, partial [bacterium]